jgi:hypothetical protein
MALGIYFPFVGLTTEKYDEAVKRLEANGAGAPKGRKFHVALEADGQLQVFDIWETQRLRGIRFGPDAGPRRDRR